MHRLQQSPVTSTKRCCCFLEYPDLFTYRKAVLTFGVYVSNECVRAPEFSNVNLRPVHIVSLLISLS